MVKDILKISKDLIQHCTRNLQKKLVIKEACTVKKTKEKIYNIF